MGEPALQTPKERRIGVSLLTTVYRQFHQPTDLDLCHLAKSVSLWRTLSRAGQLCGATVGIDLAKTSQHALAAVVPGATTRTLDKQTHMVNAKVLAPVLTEFFLGRP